MNFDLILRNVAKHISLNTREKDYFCSLLEEKMLQRKEFFLREGEVCRHSVFVTDGCLYGYTLDVKGDEHVISFAPADWWVSDMYSLITQQPAVINIQALKDSNVLMLAYEKQETLFRKVPKFERFFRIIIQNSLVASQRRVMDNLGLTAEQRFKNFCRKYPTIMASVPQKQIASYIGVTPEFFSKMRSRLSKGK